MTRVNNIVKDLDSNETLLDQFDLDFLQDDLTEDTFEEYDSYLEDEDDLVAWANSLNQF